MSFEKYYSNKIIAQREKRAERRKQASALPSDTSSSDSDDFASDATNCQSSIRADNVLASTTSNYMDLVDYTADEHDNVDEGTSVPDDSPRLFSNSCHTVAAATTSLMQFAADANLDKSHTIKLLKLVKSLLPQPNGLPVSHKNVLKIFGRTSSFSTKYICERCGYDTTIIKCGIKRCSNSQCLFSNQNLVNSRVTEIVTMDIRSSLHAIVKRNSKLILDNKNLTPTGDIVNFAHYIKNNKEKKERTLTLLLHADGAPLVRSSRQNLWPLFASVIEIPPPVRDYQRNILILALWSSRKKPDIDIFLDGTIAQLQTLMKYGTTICLDEQEYHFIVRIQGFLADLPAKSLFLKTINFNGKYACTWCLSPGEYNSTCRSMLYPFEKNDNTFRTHDEFLRNARSAASESDRTGHEIIINGVRGISPLLSIIEYPVSVLYDYMHLVCLNHISTLVKHWKVLLNQTDLSLIDERLSQQRVPHNMNIRFDFSITEVHQWKAKHGRLFILYIGLPILINILPSSHLFHFAAYALAIKLLHAPENQAEIDLAEQLILFYCQSSSLIYGSAIELYGLHSHLHLAQQVRHHGGLSYTSAFAFESCIRYTKKKAHGNRNLASQISYWTDMVSIIKQSQSTIQQSHGVDEIFLESHLLEEFRTILAEYLGSRKSGMAGRIFPCLNNNSQSSSLLSTSVTDKHSKTTENSTTTICTAKNSDPPAENCPIRKKKLSHNEKKTTAPHVSVDQLNDLLCKNVLDSQSIDVIETDDELDLPDEHNETSLSSQPLPLTPGTKRAFKGSSSIYVDIDDSGLPTDDSQISNMENTFPSELVYSTDDGKTYFNVLLITGDRTKKNLYALKLVDQLFTREELLELDPITKKQELIEHKSYAFIKEAIRCKFQLTAQQLEIEWPNIHEAILNKRRNWKKITPLSTTRTSPLSATRTSPFSTTRTSPLSATRTSPLSTTRTSSISTRDSNESHE
ncbi:unnamed protein product [Rotaria sordida]|uniref:Uncharacterized protein n=1 Tax=Rotaria sordida TaxID=392033 RepID=A0A819FEX6_9BILA|nr:unnamed protein product [Rotaria sordida]